MIDIHVVTKCSIHACKQSSCHIVALEGDTTILDAILSPLCAETPLLTCESVPHITSLVDEDEHVSKVAKHSRISKHACHLISKFSTIAYGYNFKYLIILFHVNIIVNQVQSPPNLMLMPSHIGSLRYYD